MGKRYSFREIPDGQDFTLVPLGKYPARLRVDGYQHDADGNYMTDGSGAKVVWQTRKGDDLWKLQFEILNTTSAGRIVFDNLNFSQGGLKRVKVMFVRAGFDDDYEGELEPEDLDGTYWNIHVDFHELQTTASGAPAESKYDFKNKIDCKCGVCTANDGKKVKVNPKIGFAGFDLMPAKDAAMYKASTPHEDNADVGKENCLACAEGDHSHIAGKGCPCLNVNHVPF